MDGCADAARGCDFQFPVNEADIGGDDIQPHTTAGDCISRFAGGKSRPQQQAGQVVRAHLLQLFRRSDASLHRLFLHAIPVNTGAVIKNFQQYFTPILDR